MISACFEIYTGKYHSVVVYKLFPIYFPYSVCVWMAGLMITTHGYGGVLTESSVAYETIYGMLSHVINVRTCTCTCACIVYLCEQYDTCTHVCLNRRNQLLTYVYVGKN